MMKSKSSEVSVKLQSKSCQISPKIQWKFKNRKNSITIKSWESQNHVKIKSKQSKWINFRPLLGLLKVFWGSLLGLFKVYFGSIFSIYFRSILSLTVDSVGLQHGKIWLEIWLECCTTSFFSSSFFYESEQIWRSASTDGISSVETCRKFSTAPAFFRGGVWRILGPLRIISLPRGKVSDPPSQIAPVVHFVQFGSTLSWWNKRVGWQKCNPFSILGLF